MDFTELNKRLVSYVSAEMAGCSIRLNDEQVEYKFTYSEVKGNVIRKHFYMNSIQGFIDEIRLVGLSGEVLGRKPTTIQKSDDGLVISFEIEVNVREVIEIV